MKLKRYDNLDLFRGDVVPVLLEDELNNNLSVSILTDTTLTAGNDWLMATVVDSSGCILLIAFCTKPYNMLIYIPRAVPHGRQSEILHALATELLHTGFVPPGVMASKSLAESFAYIYADIYAGIYADIYKEAIRKGADTGKNINAEFRNAAGEIKLDIRPMILMKLDKLLPYEKAPGKGRFLTQSDLTYVPSWEQAFSIECDIPSFTFEENRQRISTRISKNNHLIWEDGQPVSQAVFGRETTNIAVINWVYTPPVHRGRGYATSVAGELSGMQLDKGKKFCCLFADAANPVSRGIYHKLGYTDTAEFCEIYFKQGK